MDLVSTIRMYMVTIHQPSLSHCSEQYNVSIKVSESDIYATASGRKFHTGIDHCQFFGTGQVTFFVTLPRSYYDSGKVDLMLFS